MKNTEGYGLFRLFSNYFWLGIVFILLSIIVNINFQDLPFWASVLMRLLEAVGVAVLVASIFTYASGTSEFIDKIKNLLQDIVINRNFLGNIDSVSKREALNSLIKPSSEEKLLYSNIEGYLNTYITQTMDVTNKCVRSNYSINARAYIENHKVYVDSRISYRLYPTKDGYSDIKVGFLVGEENSICNRVVVSTQHGVREEFKGLKYEEITIDAGKARLATIDLSKYAKNCAHLDIEIDMKECGSDHWMMLSFAALIPTDKFRHMLRCEDGLIIKAHHTFIHGAKFHVDQSSDIEITVSCNEWINEGTGLSVLISLPHETPHNVPIS
ncbi:hypothetical protein [Denitrificimonas caeni]|uniref:hypothetical protein n=1 Tax=Denitrificimonas caeni TaxID=521720 RepID=UPI001965CBBC|nr:hypothetical protein [Denitrificimonas caeni]